MNRLSITLSVLVAVLSVVTIAQMVRLGGMKNETRTLRAELDAAKSETAKLAARPAAAPRADDSMDMDSGSWVREASHTATLASKGSAQNEADAQFPDNSPEATGTAGTDAARLAADLVRRGAQLAKDGKFDQALSLLQQSVKEDPDNPDAWRNLAAVQRQMGNSKAELQTYQQWMGARPADSQARYMAAQAYARNGMEGQALKYLTQYESMSGGSPQSAGLAAKVYKQLNMPKQEGDALRRAASGAPSTVQVHQQLGDYYQRQGQSDQALAEYQAALQIAPNDAKAAVQMGNTYMTLGQTDMAQSEYEAALEANPNSIEALMRLAEIQHANGDLQASIGYYQQISNLAGQLREGINANQHIADINREIQTGTTKPRKTQ